MYRKVPKFVRKQIGHSTLMASVILVDVLWLAKIC
jgi:hypothetical protein